MKPTALELTGVSAELGGRSVLHNITLHIPCATWLSVVGPNGAGKSTLLKTLAGITPYTGRVNFPLLNTDNPDPRKRAQHVAWLGQHQGEPTDLRVYDVVMLGRLPHQNWLSRADAHDHHCVYSALIQTNAWQFRERALAELSGGERQRVLLSRALAGSANILLLDEPLANLDPPHQVELLRLIRALVCQNKTVICVLHELSAALLADQVLVMHEGSLIQCAKSEDSQTHRAIERVFGHSVQIKQLGDQWVCLPKLNLDN